MAHHRRLKQLAAPPLPTKEKVPGQQQQHKLYLHDYNYVVTVLQKL